MHVASARRIRPRRCPSSTAGSSTTGAAETGPPIRPTVSGTTRSGGFAGRRCGHRWCVTSSAPSGTPRPVPVRTILAVIGLVLATALLLYLVIETRRVLTWIVIGAFFAVALAPLTGWVQRRLLGGRR